MIRGTSIVRRLAHRGVDWAGLTNKVKGDAARSEIARMRQLFDEIAAQNAAVSATVPDIDFGAYRQKIKSPGIVDAFEAEYKKLSLPSFTADSSAAEAAVSTATAAADAAAAHSTARIAQLEEQIESMIANKLTADTTVEDVYAQYPEVGEEIEQEIADMDWQKDT
eukprot:g3004.t1